MGNLCIVTHQRATLQRPLCSWIRFVGASISISFFFIAQTPTVRPTAHYIVIIIIMCYSEQYARLKRNVFSSRRKADVIRKELIENVTGVWFF